MDIDLFDKEQRTWWGPIHSNYCGHGGVTYRASSSLGGVDIYNRQTAALTNNLELIVSLLVNVVDFRNSDRARVLRVI